MDESELAMATCPSHDPVMFAQMVRPEHPIERYGREQDERWIAEYGRITAMEARIVELTVENERLRARLQYVESGPVIYRGCNESLERSRGEF